MAEQYSTTVRNAIVDSIETAMGATPILRLRTGAAPANCAAADAGTNLVSITLPSDWMSTASAGVKSLLGTWTAAAIASGVAAHFRFYDSTGTTCTRQGTVTLTGGGGDMTLDNTNIATGQSVTVSTATLTAPGA